MAQVMPKSKREHWGVLVSSEGHVSSTMEMNCKYWPELDFCGRESTIIQLSLKLNDHFAVNSA